MKHDSQDMLQTPPVVCRVTPDGDVICESGTSLDTVPADEALRMNLTNAMQAAFPGDWGPNKIMLALNVIHELGESTIPDSPNVLRRSLAVRNAVRDLMSQDPPSIMLFNYSNQPANVLGAWFLNRADLVRMQKIYDQFKEPTLP